ncbi:hypothetical protein LOC68_05250 [Blastopirellula sp. JC732]|uniref:Right handed beta helix domain-containing protein n=1 Tax=Blastopirellula sediminis TaxID=2894196 RepID=A0A9X1SF09_9BACT|nr:hypothetical protein [Blastopirellula sediminis]MCC9609430.1 hypothetical protein [Blastopirellula sediminis]MCC9627793.1 hypothetical protein [Blastopirellula sediminis]
MNNALKTYTLALGLCLIASSLLAAELHVNAETGSDSNPGTVEKPLKTLQKGISSAKEGDVIQLHPQGAVYRQAGTFGNRSAITIEGNGVTLDGADPLPEDGWEKVGANLYRRQMKRTPLDRHLLIIDGVMQRMGRTQSAGSPDFPPPSALKPGEFCFENIDDKQGWLYVCGSTKNLQWSTRVNGIATGGPCKRLVIRNLNTRNFLNDGFNVHGDCRELKFENINGYDCFDEGFSAHESAECEINGGKFYGNENGIADVNSTETVYRNCQFYGNVNVDVLLVGKVHRLIDCQIVNMTSAAALNGGPREKQATFDLVLERVSITTDKKEEKGHARVNGGTLLLKDCVIENVNLNTLGADVKYEGTNKLNGKVVETP